jgi:hypothetical protein
MVRASTGKASRLHTLEGPRLIGEEINGKDRPEKPAGRVHGPNADIRRRVTHIRSREALPAKKLSTKP